MGHANEKTFAGIPSKVFDRRGNRMGMPKNQGMKSWTLFHPGDRQDQAGVQPQVPVNGLTSSAQNRENPDW